MITKITQVVNLSRFKNFSSASDDFSLSQANLLYAPNGRGKTSVADIISSLLKNNPALLTKRISKVYPGNMEITLTHSSPLVTSRFSGSAWSNSPSGIKCLTFDKTFIQQNIHTLSVEHDHKKKLHGLIVGEGAIEAKELVTKKREELIEARRQALGINAVFAALDILDLTIEQFITLPLTDSKDLISEETALKRQLEALGDPEQIRAKASFTVIEDAEIVIPTLQASCATVIAGASREAVELTQNHLATHVHGNTNEAKAFIASGVKALGDKDAENCSLCGQTVEGEARKLVHALFTIFSADYLKLRKCISESIDSLSNLDIDAIFLRLNQLQETNAARHPDWVLLIGQLASVAIIDDFDDLKREISDSKVILITALQKKLDDPSSALTLELEAFNASVARLEIVMSEYNKKIKTLNLGIDNYKKSLDITTKQSVISRAKDIHNLLVRSSEQGKSVLDQYVKATQRQEETKKAHTAALAKFAEEQQGIIDTHGAVINQVLEHCGAKFRLDGMVQGTNAGSTEPYLEYSIKLTGGIQESQTTAAEAVGGILSDGEKNLLAFAFFWSLIQHSTLNQTIAIFDDPLSSIDELWRFQLINKLKELCDNGLLQLFVLTHYEDFARVIAFRMSNIKQLTITAGSSANGNRFAPFDIEAFSKELQFSRIDRMSKYIDTPTIATPKDIQADIRNTLEAALKYKYYLKLLPLIEAKKWLRDFIDEPSVKLILETNGTYNELETLCTISAWANHDNPIEVVLSEDQARTYAQQTLDVIERL